MRRSKISLTVISLVFVFSLAFSLQAQDDAGKFSGKFMLGYRFVDTDGSINKYKEDINLEDGARLFNFSLSYTPGESLKKMFDRIDLNIQNFGGDPFETLGFSVQKYGKYKFQYDRKKSTYFYGDLYESGGSLYDLHTFNFDRRMDSALFKVWLGKYGSVFLNYDKFTKTGDSVTTFDINRIEFEFDKPIEEESRVVSFGIDLHVNRFSVMFEEKIQDYENTNSLFIPGYTDGGAGARYPSSLSVFFINQPYTLESNTHTFKFTARPFDSLLVSGSAQLGNQDTEIGYEESAEGVSYLNRYFKYDLTGSGSFERKTQLYDLDISYLMFNKLALTGAVRYNNFEQDGTFTIENDEVAAIHYDSLGFEGGLQYQFSSKFGLTVGYRNEERELRHIETVDYEDTTTRKGFFGNLKFDPSQTFKLTLDYQRGDYENPFSLISPTDFDRFKAAVKIRVDKFNASGSFFLNKSKSDYGEKWESTKNQFNLRIGYHGEKVGLFAGYSYIKVEHDADRTVAYPPGWSGAAGTFDWDIFYEGKSNLLDASVSFRLTENLTLGSYFNSYTNKGFWEISRTMFKGYLEYTFDCGITAQAGYRYVDFNEKNTGADFNDYSASIFEISLGHRWK